jgi:hypothetical protein
MPNEPGDTTRFRIYQNLHVGRWTDTSRLLLAEVHSRNVPMGAMDPPPGSVAAETGAPSFENLEHSPNTLNAFTIGPSW